MHSSRMYSIPGLPLIGKSSFGNTLVNGSKRVPKPAKGIIACLIIQMFYLLKSFIQMKILLNNSDLNEALENVSNLGFVPTMGSLHKGHISLIKQSKKKCSKTIVSIFVNPKQFNNKNDFKKYPRNRKKDLSILKNLKLIMYIYQLLRKFIE